MKCFFFFFYRMFICRTDRTEQRCKFYFTRTTYGNDFKIIEIKEPSFLSKLIFSVLNSKSSLYVFGLLI